MPVEDKEQSYHCHIPSPWTAEASPRELQVDEGSRDPSKVTQWNKVTDKEISDHHNQNLSPVIPVEFAHLKSNLVKPKHHAKRQGNGERRPATPPAQKVEFLLGEDHDEDPDHKPHQLFTEMEELFVNDVGILEWKETARWIKFEEEVESGGNRWSKPHVATLSLHSLFEVRSLLTLGTVCLDMVANTLEEVVDLAVEQLVNNGQLGYERKMTLKNAILQKHWHQHEGNGRNRKTQDQESGGMHLIRSLAEIGRRHTTHAFHLGRNHANMSPSVARTSVALASKPSETSLADDEHKPNVQFMRKIPKDSEAANILVGHLSELDRHICVFIRLQKPKLLGDLTEVPLPTRFIFIYLGPENPEERYNRYHEVGRSMATVLTDEVFHNVAYKAKSRQHLITGLDEFLDSVTVLPPGEWDPSIRIEPPSNVPSSQDTGRMRKKITDPEEKVLDEDEIHRRERKAAGLYFSKKPFGGLVADIKRKLPWYVSDFRDGLNLQCLSSIIFIYFAVLSPVVTFGGLLGEATDNHISVIEALIGGMAVGLSYGFFSGQPLSILGPTGPILVFETIIFKLCKTMEWEFLAIRFWIAMWIFVYLMIGVATDSSALVCFITRFTEENFACLIAVIFIVSSFQKVYNVGVDYPLNPSPCECIPQGNYTDIGPVADFTPLNFTDDTRRGKYPCAFEIDDTEISGVQTPGCHYIPNVYMTTILLFAATYLIIVNLKKLKTSPFFPTWVRGFFSDFAVIIAILVMTVGDYLIGVDTQKLMVPATIQPTVDRSWVVDPFGHNPWWTCLAASIPAILATILIFMDQQITVVIVNRKEHKLKKGCGYHLDLFVVASMVAVCGLFGFPFCEASTVPAVNHVRSLHMESETSAPGEKPQFLGIREQRVTHICVFILIGLSAFMAPMLSLIPMPVLFGVFLFMGVATLDGLQFYDRLLLFFMPKKYQPDMPYLRRVPLMRVHLFTLIELVSLIALWVIKDIKETSILFPIMLMFMVAIRKGLEYVFTPEELQILDDVFPSFKRKEQLDNEDLKSRIGEEDKADAVSLRYTSSGQIEVPMANGNVIKIPVPQDKKFNISEEMNNCGVWRSMEGSQIDLSPEGKFQKQQKPHHSGKNKRKRQTRKKMIIVHEVEEPIRDDDDDEYEDGGLHMNKAYSPDGDDRV